jgi:hypothetical protein
VLLRSLDSPDVFRRRSVTSGTDNDHRGQVRQIVIMLRPTRRRLARRVQRARRCQHDLRSEPFPRLSNRDNERVNRRASPRKSSQFGGPTSGDPAHVVGQSVSNGLQVPFDSQVADNSTKRLVSRGRSTFHLGCGSTRRGRSSQRHINARDGRYVVGGRVGMYDLRRPREAEQCRQHHSQA